MAYKPHHPPNYPFQFLPVPKVRGFYFAPNSRKSDRPLQIICNYSQFSYLCIMKVLKWLDFGIFPGQVLFSVGRSYDELMSELERCCKRNDYWAAGIDGESAYFGAGGWFACGRSAYNKRKNITHELYYIIITDEFDFSDWHFCKLAHEVLHICQFFLPEMLDRNKETEAEAWFHTHLMRQCIEALRAEKTKIEKQKK